MGAVTTATSNPSLSDEEAACQLADPHTVTSLGDDAAFSARTMLRLNIKLGPREIMEPYK